MEATTFLHRGRALISKKVYIVYTFENEYPGVAVWCTHGVHFSTPNQRHLLSGAAQIQQRQNGEIRNLTNDFKNF